MQFNKTLSRLRAIVVKKEGIVKQCNCHEDLAREVKILARIVTLLYTRQGELMADFTKLNTSIDRLDADVRAHEAAEDAATQASVDAAQAKVDAIDTFVVGTATGS